MSEITKEAIQKIRRLEIQTTHLVDELFAGQWLSTFKGKGIEFEDIRQYVPGDAVNSIDWYVTARTGIPHIRQYREERELSVMLLIDLSASTSFGTDEATKREAIAQLGAILAYSAMRNQDKVGLLLFTDQIERILIPKKGVTHGVRVLRDLLYFQPKGKRGDIGKAFSALGNIQKKRSIVFLFSDFLFPVQKTLYWPIAKKHDLIAIAMQDPIEQTFPPLGYLHLTDSESGQNGYFDLQSVTTQKEFQKNAKKHIEEHRRSIIKSGGSFLSLSSNTSPVEALQRFMHERRRR